MVKLTANVTVMHENVATILREGETLPKWAHKLVGAHVLDGPLPKTTNRKPAQNAAAKKAVEEPEPVEEPDEPEDTEGEDEGADNTDVVPVDQPDFTKPAASKKS